MKKGAFVLCMILLVQLTVFNVYSDDYDFRNNKAVYADAIERRGDRGLRAHRLLQGR